MDLALFFIVAISIGIYLYKKRQVNDTRAIGLERFRDARILKDMPMWRIDGCFHNEKLASNSESRANLIALMKECTGRKDGYTYQEIRKRVIHDYYAKTIDCSAPTEEEVFNKLAENETEEIRLLILIAEANNMWTTIFEDLMEESFGFRSFL